MLPMLQTDEACYLPRARGRSQLAIASRYRHRDGEHEILLEIAGPSRRHVAAVERGDVEFALVSDSRRLNLCFRFGCVIPWSAARFEVAHHPTELSIALERPGSIPERRVLIHVELLDARTGSVCATRNATVSLDFSRVLQRALAARQLVPLAAVDGVREFNFPTRPYARPESLVEQAICRSFGSD